MCTFDGMKVFHEICLCLDEDKILLFCNLLCKDMYIVFVFRKAN